MKTSATENTIDPASANQPEKKLSGFAAACSDIRGSERNPETLEVLKAKPSYSKGGDLNLRVLNESGGTEMTHTNSHVIATSMVPTWLPVALLGHCVAVFQPCDGLTFYPVQASRLAGKGSMGRFPGEDPVNTQEPGMSESKFRLGSRICLLQAS